MTTLPPCPQCQSEFTYEDGNLLIGHAYTRRMGLEPGQEFKIEIHQETGSIWLLPMDEGSSTDENNSADQAG